VRLVLSESCKQFEGPKLFDVRFFKTTPLVLL
jgi:hypothetical protein